MKKNKLQVVKLMLSLICICLITLQLNAQQRVKKVIFQGFWWDNWNNNFRFRWADYLTELAPRLKALGVDAIWIPPNLKNDGPGSVGYSPFDHYDLGDKFQKGETASDTVRTRSGNKDELLRMIAVMHANGIEVVQDIVLNHSSGAGNRGGGGGRDFNAASQQYNDFSTNYWKNFRYISYATPHQDTSAADYWTRSGRWSKNLPNFYPNPNNNSVNTNAINSVYFGPDMAYESNSIGRSFTIPTSGSFTINGNTRPYFNPVQPNNYMASSAKDWIIWYKKQTGCDGFRWDAVKHFGFDVQRDLTFALKYQSGWANGGNSMFNVGEWVGTTSEVDFYASQLVRSGTPVESGVTNEQMSGGFDFGLRGYGPNGGIYSMVHSNGSFNMQNIPGAQQNLRFFDYPNGTRVHKTVPFVNSHDTYRPNLTATGNYSAGLGNNAGWNTSQELGGNGAHIDPREPRFAAANAIIAAVDGNPCFYIEDVFDYFSVNRRWTHLPTNRDSLPLRVDVGNIMQCHQALNFKDGDYAVPTSLTGTGISPVYAKGSSGDHLVLERTGKAIIGVTDAFSTANNNNNDQEVWVTASNAWPTGTILYDYSGAHGISGTQIFNDRRVLIRTAPCGHTIPGAFGHGYSIWAPFPNGTPTSVQDLYNVLTTYNQPLPRTTTQEWEMADDLGDSHCASLGQGGQLPANSTNQRVCGKIFVEAGKPVNYKLFPGIDNTNITIGLFNLDGIELSSVSGNSTAANPISNIYTPTSTGWITIKVRNTNNTQPGQKVWANVTYTAPTTVNTRDAANNARTRVSIWTGNKGTSDITDCGNWEEGIIPNNNSTVIVPSYSLPSPIFPNGFAGRIIAPTNVQGSFKNVLNANVTINSPTTYTFIANTGTTGSFTSSNFIPVVNRIRPSKNNDIVKSNGVTSIDVLLVQRHILNTAKLNSPYKIIAADVNGDRNVGSTDLLRMRRLILGTDTTFRNTLTTENRLWAFVDSAYVFPDSTNPFPFKDSIMAMPRVNGLLNNQTFIGLKLGDVNYDWNPANSRTALVKPVQLVVSSENLNNSQKVFKFTTNNFVNIAAMQYTLHFNNEKYEFVGIENNKLNILFNSNKANETGNISMLWTDEMANSKSLDNKELLFSLVLKDKQTGSFINASKQDISINNDIAEIEAWTENNRQTKVELISKLLPSLNEEQQLIVFPNPSKGNVNIKTNGVKEIKISDVLGRVISTKNINSQSSFTNITLKKGVYFLKATMLDETEKFEKLIVE